MSGGPRVGTAGPRPGHSPAPAPAAAGTGRPLRLAMAAAGASWLAACLGGPQADPSAFFLLSSTVVEAAGGAVPVSIGIASVALPGYLDRPQIVTRVSDNEIDLAEVDRWAEPLASNLARTLEESLARLLPGSSYVAYPWYASDAPDYVIALQVRRFEADAAGAVLLDAAWTLEREGARVDGRAVRVEEQADGPARADAVAAQSRALAEVARELAEAVRRAAGR